MRATTTTWTLPGAARVAALMALVAAGAGACEHTGSLEPPSPRPVPAASIESGEMESLLLAFQRETRAQGPADPAREQLFARLLAAARAPAPAGSEVGRPAAAVPTYVEHALSRLLAADGDSAVMVSVLQELADRSRSTP
ncbi:hypothetical protein [Longimicrobium sp.]|uniref:hypothetical protein n=1 Tax=Longimicrobium sp. TaxID=2029185 RepID=UPI003B3AA05C